MKNHRFVASLIAVAVSSLSMPSWSADGVDVEAYVRKGTFESLTISPTGDYLAATVPLEDRTGLAILRRSDGKRMAAFALGKDSHISQVHWVAPDRVLMEMARTEGQLDAPQLTGEIYGIKVDGTQGERLLGGEMEEEGSASRIRARDPENAWAFLVDDLPADDKYAIVSVSPWAREPYTRAERIDVQTGRGRIVAKAPVQNGRFTTDNQGVVRFVRGSGEDNASKLYYRANAEAEWQLVNDTGMSALSPTTMADRIKVPVFLAAGGEDTVTPVEHTRNMESALKRAGVPVESLYYPTEGHGFYTPARRVEYYTRLLAFLSEHLGGKTAAAAGGKGP